MQVCVVDACVGAEDEGPYELGALPTKVSSTLQAHNSCS